MACRPTYFANLSLLSIGTFYPIKDGEGSIQYHIAPGLSKLDILEDEIVDSIYTQAQKHLNNLRRLQFELVYYLRFTKQDVDRMSYMSLQNWYELLVEKKEKESTIHER